MQPAPLSPCPARIRNPRAHHSTPFRTIDSPPHFYCRRCLGQSVAGGYKADVQVSFIDWGIKNNIKLNLGMIAAYKNTQGVLKDWPTTPFLDKYCRGSNKDTDFCRVAVKLADSFDANHIRMESNESNAHHEPVLQLFNHAYDHNRWFCWSNKSTGQRTPDQHCDDCLTACGYTDTDWATQDLKRANKSHAMLIVHSI